MASVHHVKPELRRHALGVPAAVLARLSAAELQARCAEAERLHEGASVGQAEHVRYLTRRGLLGQRHPDPELAALVAAILSARKPAA